MVKFILLIIVLIVLVCKCKSEKYTGKTIFVSIASYRDNQCKLTLKELFNKAKFPASLTIGICDQWQKKDELCGDIKNIKIK